MLFSMYHNQYLVGTFDTATISTINRFILFLGTVCCDVLTQCVSKNVKIDKKLKRHFVQPEI